MSEDKAFAEALDALRLAQSSCSVQSRESALLGVLRAGPSPSADDANSMLEALLDSCNFQGASSTEQQYALGALVCQVQDLLGCGCLPAAAVSRAACVAVDVLGALSFSGSSDANNEDEALALVSSCAALLCLLSTESDASAALVPEDTSPKALTSALSKALSVAVQREGGSTPPRAETADVRGDGGDNNDEDESEGERDAATAAAAAAGAVEAPPMVGQWEQCLEHLAVSVWYQTRVPGRAARLVDAGAAAALAEVVSAVASCAASNTVSNTEVWGLSACTAACSALLALVTQPPRSANAAVRKDVSTKSAAASKQLTADTDIRSNDDTNAGPPLSHLPGLAGASAAKMLTIIFEKASTTSTPMPGSSTVGPKSEAPAYNLAQPLTSEEASAIAARVALPARLLVAGLAHPGWHGQRDCDAPGGYGQGGRKREIEAVEAAARALDALCRTVLRRPGSDIDAAANSLGKISVSIAPVPSNTREKDGKEESERALDIAWAGALSQDLLAAIFRGAAVEQSTVRTLRRAVDSARFGSSTSSMEKSSVEAVARAGQSSLPGAGEGLFATHAIPAGTFVAFYPGEWWPEPEATSWWDSLPPQSSAAAYTATLKDGMLLDGCPAATARAVATAQAAAAAPAPEEQPSSTPNLSTSDGAAGSEATGSAGVRKWLTARQCLGPLANHPPHGAWPNLVFYEIPAGWFGQAGLPDGHAADYANGGSLLSRLPLTCAASSASSQAQLPNSVLALVTLRTCAAGEELFVDYGASANRRAPSMVPSEHPVDDERTQAIELARGDDEGAAAAATTRSKGKDVLPEWCQSPWAGTVAAAHGLGRAWKITGLPP